MKMQYKEGVAVLVGAICCCLVTQGWAEGTSTTPGEDSNLVIVTKPSSLQFNAKRDRISSVQLGNLISTVMGFTVDLTHGGYSGAYVTNPFNPPRIVVGVRMNLKSMDDGLKGVNVPLKENMNWDELYSLLVERSEKRLDHMRTDYFTAPNENSVSSTATILEKMSKDVIENGSVSPMIYFFDMANLNIIDSETEENFKKLQESVEALRGLMFVVKSNESAQKRSRKARQVSPSPSPAPPSPTPAPTPADLNLAPDVSEDYPVVFNIILFLSIALILSLIAISVVLATMDPGRDSLIYRVTSAQRFKKDN